MPIHFGMLGYTVMKSCGKIHKPIRCNNGTHSLHKAIGMDLISFGAVFRINRGHHVVKGQFKIIDVSIWASYFNKGYQ